MSNSDSIAAKRRQAASDKAFEVRMLHEAGVLGLHRPDKSAKVVSAFLRWGASPALGITTAAIHYPHEIALVDERGALSFERLQRRSNALAHSFAGMGIGHGDGVGIMCRNHRGFVEATLAAAKLGASSLYLNTMFAGPQLVEVTRREAPKALVYDSEFAGLLEGVDDSVARIVGWVDDGEEPEELTLEKLIAAGDEGDHKPPPDKPRFVILTSGTTGTPKGAQRSSPDGLMSIAALIDKIPFRSRETMMIAAPLFHSWGFFHFIMSLPTASTMVLRRRFDPEGTLRAVQESRAQVLAGGAGDGAADPRPAGGDPRLLRPLFAADHLALGVGPAGRAGDRLDGPLRRHRLQPLRLDRGRLRHRRHPGGSARCPRHRRQATARHHGEDRRRGRARGAAGRASGRIFVGNEMSFEGYTGGGGKESIDGLLCSGDVGHIDAGGRLFIDGRDDEMIVSGGENVFPREVEDLLADHEAVAEIAVIGVEDTEFGQRLKAFVVAKPGVEVGEDDLKAHVKANLAGYKTPREIEFLDELPRNATGKVLKRDLHARQTKQSA